MPVQTLKFKKLKNHSLQVAGLAALSIFSTLASAQGITEGENSTTGENNLSLGGISTRSSLSLSLYSSSIKNNIVQVARGNSSAENLALVVSGQFVISPRLALLATLPYESTKSESQQSFAGTSIATKVQNNQFGYLSLGLRYLLLPESNGFALIGSAAVSTTIESKQPSTQATIAVAQGTATITATTLARPSDKTLQIGLNPRWRINDNLTAAMTVDVRQSQQFKGSQGIGAGLIWRATPVLTVSPSIEYRRSDGRGDNGSSNSIFAGAHAFYDLDANWRLRTSAYFGQTSPSVFRGVEQTDKGKSTNLSIGLTRFF